ncbi:unnamed protein product [Dovyalis caffra]|uniref:Uncharacterized protein n=1 Tax=Dovyalis caffra TaxID=77055 RepID=A0AAV1QMU8_9ROSI|nr:unnamed protein product [Dovyalis caffra]
MHCREVSPDSLIVNEEVDFVPSPGVEFSYKNDLCLVSLLQFKEPRVYHALAGHSNGHSASNSACELVPRHSPPNNLRGSGWLENIKSAEEEGRNSTRRVVLAKRTISLFNGKSSGEMSVCHQVNLDSLQRKHAEPFACHSGTMKALCQNYIQDSSSATNTHDAEDRRIGE